MVGKLYKVVNEIVNVIFLFIFNIWLIIVEKMYILIILIIIILIIGKNKFINILGVVCFKLLKIKSINFKIVKLKLFVFCNGCFFKKFKDVVIMLKYKYSIKGLIVINGVVYIEI